MQVELSFDDSSALALLSKVESIDWTRPLKQFGGYVAKEVGQQILAAGDPQRGGSGRGVFWRPRREYYTRRDGTLIPAWGGVPKVRGQGQVLGRKTKGGARLTASSRILGGVKNPGSLLKRKVSGDTLTIEPTRPFVAYQHDMRQFLFFHEPKDSKALEGIALSFARKTIKGGR